MNKRLIIIGALLGLLTTVVLSWAHLEVGYARDEGVYFQAGRHYGAWVARVFSEPGEALKPETRDRYFRLNNEHPALMKTAAGVSGRLFSRAPVAEAKPRRDVDLPEGGAMRIMREGAAMRLPAQLLAGLGVFLLFLCGRRFGRGVGAGILCAGWFILQPRVFFHAGLNTFDVPIAVATLAVVLVYMRALDRPRWAIGLGVALGVAIAIKHNALFIAPLLGLHYVACLAHARFRQGRKIALGQLLPLPFVSMAVLAPLVAVALWPWLWTDTFARIGEYFAFHREHAYYNMEFLGTNYNRPPLPISYPAVMTFATVPATLLALAAIGIVSLVRADIRIGNVDAAEGGSFMRPLPDGWPRLDGSLLTIFAAFPLALIALPWIPIFGGTKHWLTAYPFLALAAAAAWGQLWSAVTLPDRWRHAPSVALVLVLVPGTWATIDGHPYGLSQYAPLVGGARGAAKLGLNRGFWGYAAPPLFEESGPTRVYLHDIHDLARRQYAREGRWPEGWTPARMGRSRAGFLFYEQHMAVDEIGLWNTYGTTRPSGLITLDDVPLTGFYER